MCDVLVLYSCFGILLRLQIYTPHRTINSLQKHRRACVALGPFRAPQTRPPPVRWDTRGKRRISFFPRRTNCISYVAAFPSYIPKHVYISTAVQRSSSGPFRDDSVGGRRRSNSTSYYCCSGRFRPHARNRKNERHNRSGSHTPGCRLLWLTFFRYFCSIN